MINIIELPKSFICINTFKYNSNKRQQRIMKISSPFVDYIPECKKNMRKLRKKIYKFITSKTYHKKHQEGKDDLLNIFKQRDVPVFLLELLSKKKTVDLNSIKNMNVSARLSLREMLEITLKQEEQVSENHKEWIESSKVRNKHKSFCYLEGLREKESLSKRTLSSTEFQCDQQQEHQASSHHYEEHQSSQNQVNQNLNHDIEFHHFARGNSFLEIESSILSQENLFKFQQ